MLPADHRACNISTHLSIGGTACHDSQHAARLDSLIEQKYWNFKGPPVTAIGAPGWRMPELNKMVQRLAEGAWQKMPNTRSVAVESGKRTWSGNRASKLADPATPIGSSRKINQTDW